MKKRISTEEARLEEEKRRMFLEGLDRYRARGVKILIDGHEFQAGDQESLFRIGEDGSFYMGDYVGGEDGKLTEIHFDRVYYK